jgi:hypothetical protein
MYFDIWISPDSLNKIKFHSVIAGIGEHCHRRDIAAFSPFHPSLCQGKPASKPLKNNLTGD